VNKGKKKTMLLPVLCIYETLFLSPRKNRFFSEQGDEKSSQTYEKKVTGKWKKLHNEELL
jgi:hypothetical protein